MHVDTLTKSEIDMIIRLETLRKSLNSKFVTVNKKKFPERLVNFIKNSFEFRCMIGSETSEEIKSEWLAHKGKLGYIRKSMCLTCPGSQGL